MTTNKIRQFRILIFSIFGLLYRSITNFIKPFIGRPKYTTSGDKFLKYYICSRLTPKNRPIEFAVTSDASPREGPATQALYMMFTLNFSYLSGIPYFHTKFSHIHHSDRPMREWVNQWEEYFNIGTEEIPACNSDVKVFNYPEISGLLLLLYRRNSSADLIPCTLDKIRRKFYQNKSLYINTDKHLTVCIHMRRGDVNKYAFPRMYTEPVNLIKTISHLISILDGQKVDYKLHFFSQGELEDFKDFENLNLIYHLDEDPIWCHEQLVRADILVTAKSAFSYMAAVLNKGIILCESANNPHWWRSLEHWILRTYDGSFDSKKLRAELGKFDWRLNSRC